jgi:hypothetical protein
MKQEKTMRRISHENICATCARDARLTVDAVLSSKSPNEALPRNSAILGREPVQARGAD